MTRGTSCWLPSGASVFFTDAPKPFESWSSNHLMYNIISFWHVICLFSYGNRKEVSVRKHLLRATIMAGFIGLAPLAYANPIAQSHHHEREHNFQQLYMFHYRRSRRLSVRAD